MKMEGWLRKLYLTLKLRWICVLDEIPPMNISLLIDRFAQDPKFFEWKMIFDLVESRKNEFKDGEYTKFENRFNIIETLNSSDLSASIERVRDDYDDPDVERKRKRQREIQEQFFKR